MRPELVYLRCSHQRLDYRYYYYGIIDRLFVSEDMKSMM